ncbi:divalent metal cation transporter [Mariniblastus sp.]|nr:divalent metal cation transporter [Mariniblastus sp.]
MNDRTFRDREILAAAQEKGAGATMGAYLRLSGPGWLQSAITLGGGSLGSALYLGMIGGTDLLWVQLVSIIAGVVMLSAISYVTLSTGKRPFPAINQYINPVLGVGWITATILANMIFILPQFSLCFDAIDKNLGGNLTGPDARVLPFASMFVDKPEMPGQILVSAVLAILATAIVYMNFKPGWASKTFDLVLKAMVGFVVLCFVFAVYKLAGILDWKAIFSGYIPNPFQWTTTAGDLSALLKELPDKEVSSYWSEKIVGRQQGVLISSAAAAVGINMTFLLPYSMLARGWDRTFRGLARWDLITGMAIPFVLVTSCIVITSAYAFHAKADPAILSSNADEVVTSDFFGKVSGTIADRMKLDDSSAALLEKIDAMPVDSKEKDELKEQKKAQADARNKAIADYLSTMPASERTLALSLVKPDSKQLAASLRPALGENSDFIFGLGVLGMGFSSIIILMLINGYALAEIVGNYDSFAARIIGSTTAGIMGFFWFLIWTGASRTYLVVVAGTFAVILLPIAYLAFFLMMNNEDLMGDDKPVGVRRIIWNIAMLLSVLLAVAAACLAIQGKISSPQGGMVVGGVATFLLLMMVGFAAKFNNRIETD